MMRFSSTDSDGKSRRPSGTSVMPRRTTSSAERPPTGRPRKATESAGTSISPAMARSSVLLPAPLAPMIASTSPASTASETPKSA